MCGRFETRHDPLIQYLVQIAEIIIPGLSFENRFNIAPTEKITVLLDVDSAWQAREMRWWLVPSRSNGPSHKYAMFNAKAETIEEKRSYREPFRSRRCIVPVSGYYEWTKEASGRVPWHIKSEEGSFAFAALWDRWEGDDQVIESCTIITKNAPPGMQEIHHRVPVALEAEQLAIWADPQTPLDQLKAMLVDDWYPAVEVVPVSTYVNNSRNGDSRCIEPIGEKRKIP